MSEADSDSELELLKDAEGESREVHYPGGDRYLIMSDAGQYEAPYVQLPKLITSGES